MKTLIISELVIFLFIFLVYQILLTFYQNPKRLNWLLLCANSNCLAENPYSKLER